MAFSFNNDFSSPPDDISLFLRQLLHRSSSSSSSSSPAVPTSSIPSMLANSGNLNVGFSSSASAPSDSYLRPPGRSVMTFSNSDRPVVDCSLAAVPNAGLSFWNEIPARVCSNLTSSSAAPVESDSPTAGSTQLRSAENDADDYDCDSEEGLEEGQTKQDQPRHSSKRSRAAEVHNQSEKRRRSRINEKMKALQNLIPNSNKTDKASMLDEAIEYLKQLQLQVQMLSMRNGLILHPMYASGFPEVLDPVQLSGMGMNFGSTGGSLDASIGKTLASDPDTSTRRHLDNLPCTLTAEAPFPLQSSMANQLSSFGLPPSSQSQNICREVDNMSRHHLVIKDCQTNALESLTTMPTPVSMYNSQPSYTQGVMQSSSNSHNQLFSSNLNGLGRGRSEP